jgi:ATP-binding protein involved in chromosome partitioning
MKKKINPISITKADDTTLTIAWSDDLVTNHNVLDLRKACQCAHCVDEMTREQILKPEDVSNTVRPIKVKTLGRYALTMNWTDGHGSSIYSWNKLRALADEPI